MPEQNLVTRLYEVASGLGQLADALERETGRPAPNLLFWRQEIIDVAEKLAELPAEPSASQRETH